MGEKLGVKKILVLSVFLLLVIPFCHASFLSWFEGITGLATQQPTDLNISVGNAPPFILDIVIPLSVDPVDSDTVNVDFSFTATDPDGISSFVNDSANATFTLDADGLGNEMQLNATSCTPSDTGNNATVQNYSCVITMRYWDKASDWSVNVTVSDFASRAADYNETFTYNSLTAINMTPSIMNWAPVTVSSLNQLSISNPIIVGNTGNYIISNGNVNTSAIDLGGEIVKSEFITADNFTISTLNSCDTGTVLQNNTAGEMVIVGSDIPSGLVMGEQASDELLYLCLEELPQFISQQSYSTADVGPWAIGVV